MRSVNPATGETVLEVLEPNAAQVEAQLQVTYRVWREWRRMPVDQRAKRLQQAAVLLRERRDDLALLMATEMGKPVTQGRAEIDKCAWVCEYYAEQGPGFLESRPTPTEAGRSWVSFQPLGIVLGIMPWNFPFWQVFRFCAPLLLAGNAGLLKHASNVPGCALAIEELLAEAGFSRHLFKSLLIGSDRIADLIRHPAVAAVSLTGSTGAGRAVARIAGDMLKKTVLELGGSDAYLVLADADLEQAAQACVTSRLINNGQSCIAAKRFVVVREVKDAFEQRVRAIMSAVKTGDPLEDGTELGPMARIDLRDELHAQVQRTIQAGARLLLGGQIPEGPGAFYPPTVLTDVPPESPASREELFGPVAAIILADDEPHALRLANETRYGLGAAVFSRDVARAQRLAERELEAGSCAINDFVRSDPRLPFGGIKESGYGRELGAFGILEFVNIKTIVSREP